MKNTAHAHREEALDYLNCARPIGEPIPDTEYQYYMAGAITHAILALAATRDAK